jgi:hypothetical protein
MNVPGLAVLVLRLSAPHDDPCLTVMRAISDMSLRVRHRVEPKPYAALKSAYVKIHGGCDDGGPGEAMSDLTVGTIALNWETVTELFQKMDSDSDFDSFVVKHVDATCDGKELRTILGYSSKSCPKTYSRHCDELGAAAKDALATINFHTKPAERDR